MQSRKPKFQIPCFQVYRFSRGLCKFQIPSFRVSGAPPWVRRGTPKSRFHVSKCADSRILLRKFQFPRFRVCRFQDTPRQIPDSEFPSFRVPLLGPSPRDPQIPDSEFPSFRGPLFGPRQRDTQIPDSEFPRFRGPPLGSKPEGRPNSRFRVSEFPRSLLGMLLGSSREGPTFSCFRVKY